MMLEHEAMNAFEVVGYGSKQSRQALDWPKQSYTSTRVRTLWRGFGADLLQRSWLYKAARLQC